MSEKEKMLSGLPYDSWDTALVDDRMHAKAMCHEFNLFDPTKLTERMNLLRSMLSIKNEAHIEPNFFCDYGYNIEIGDNFYSNHNLTIIDVCKVSIGDNALFGPNVMISTAAHPVDPIERRKTEFGASISIGNDVWIGGNVSVLAGVTLGNNCVIGAGSVVTKDIPSDSVAVGSPCCVIKGVGDKR